jgi:3-isopropylmalate dehydrogenase
MMLEHGFGLKKESLAIFSAVEKTLEDGYRCLDIKEDGKTILGTVEIGTEIAKRIK